MPSQATTLFTFLDGLRLLAGLFLLNSCLSWWFTSTKTWGYDGKYIDARYWKYRTVGEPLNLTIQDLSQFDGTNPKLPIYIGINGSVFDVSRSRETYGPKGSYSFFSGRDSARAFVTGCFSNKAEFTYDLRGIDPDEAKADIQAWQKYFHNHRKYWYVGTVMHEPISGEPPDPCTHQKYPG